MCEPSTIVIIRLLHLVALTHFWHDWHFLGKFFSTFLLSCWICCCTLNSSKHCNCMWHATASMQQVQTFKCQWRKMSFEWKKNGSWEKLGEVDNLQQFKMNYNNNNSSNNRNIKATLSTKYFNNHSLGQIYQRTYACVCVCAHNRLTNCRVSLASCTSLPQHAGLRLLQSLSSSLHQCTSARLPLAIH